MCRIALAAAVLAFAAPGPAAALDLPAGARRTALTETEGAADLPVGAAVAGDVPRREFPGHVAVSAYAVDGTASTHALIAPLREQLRAGGWVILADCETAACGGFDFRFALAVLPEPAMHVDLGDFRYLAATRNDEAVAILASRRGSLGYLQITAVGPSEGGAPPGAGTGVTPPPEPAVPPDGAGLAAALDAHGHVVLGDLDFGTGSTDLGPGPHASLRALADYLSAHPGRRVVLVGHTDATGSLDVNMQVSRRRAQAVLERLVNEYGVARDRLGAAGIGYLSPVRSNLTEEGRTANRRVEAVLVATE